MNNSRQAVFDRVMALDASPAAKRKSLLQLGIKTHYQPHQGKREIERRKRRAEKQSSGNNG